MFGVRMVVVVIVLFCGGGLSDYGVSGVVRSLR